MQLPIKRMDPDLPMPSYAHPGDAGLDLCSAVDVVIGPLERVLVPTGVAVGIPAGHAGFVQPRSGLALKYGLSFPNTPGLIDSHYRGEVKVILVNLDAHEPLRIARGDRIAQLVVVPVATCEPIETDDLGTTVRGEGGFGSTGI